MIDCPTPYMDETITGIALIRGECFKMVAGLLSYLFNTRHWIHLMSSPLIAGST